MTPSSAEEFIVPVAVRPSTALIRAIFLFPGIFGVIKAFIAHTGKALQPPSAPSLSINILTCHSKPPENVKISMLSKVRNPQGDCLPCTVLGRFLVAVDLHDV